MNEDKSDNKKKGNVRDVLLQLIREMGFPFLVAACWTIYSILVTADKRNVVDIISVFGGSFFFTCWGFAQWFRVKKQQAVESGLGGILKKQEALVAALSEATVRLEGHATGGKSVGWLMLVNPRDGVIENITAHVEGDYPLLDARATVIDLSKIKLGRKEFIRTGQVNDLFKYYVNFTCGSLQPGLATLQNRVLNFDHTQEPIRFMVEWTARNGIWRQYVELKRNGNGYINYTAILRDEEWVYENPPRESIPKRSDGKPDVFWHTGIAEALNEYDV